MTLLKCTLMLVILITGTQGIDLLDKHRVKRKIVFTKNSKFFIRLNAKLNIIPEHQLYAVAYGYRVNFDLPESYEGRHKFYKRDIAEIMSNVASDYIQKGYTCLMKEFCLTIEKYRQLNECKMICGITNILLNATDTDAKFAKSILEKCEYFMAECPYDLTESTTTNYI